jgi:hypothetical protein
VTHERDPDDYSAKTRSPERQGDHGRTTGRRGGAATGLEALKMSPRSAVPREVQASFVLWLTAVAAGVLETLIRVIYPLSEGSGVGEADLTGIVIRVVVYTVVIYIIAQMRLGKRWARTTLAVLLGGIGTLSLMIDPILWLAGGNALGEVFAQADLLFYLVAPVRAVHLAAVVTALVFMFLPAANTYFRAAQSGTRWTLG